MRQHLLLAAIVLTAAGTLIGAPLSIPIRNFSFEQPGTGKANMSEVPGWRFDGPGTPLAGVETGYEPSDGFWSAYMEGGANDTPIWQLTDYVIGEGDVFELRVDARITWAATTMEMTLFYDADGVRIVIASQCVKLTSSMAEYTLPFSAGKMPMSIGHRIGVLFANASPASTWIGIDNVRLTRVADSTPTLATQPHPMDRSTETPRDIELSWTPGEFAVAHDLYLGTDFNAVSNADRNNPSGVFTARGITANSFHPGRLEFGRTYYWRVDEVNAPPNSDILDGRVWSFTVEPLARRIENVTVTASSTASSASARNTANGAGLDANDRHSAYAPDMWLTVKNSPKPAWIQYDFGRLCKLHEMWIWNYNGRFEDMLGFGVRDASIEYSADGTDWVTLGQFELAQGPGEPGYVCNNTIPFGDIPVRWVRITIYSGWGASGQFGLSEVRFFHTPAFAREPQPASSDREVAVDSTLSWQPGREAVLHRIHISTSADTVANGTALTDTIPDNSYSPANLSLGTKYYWRVDEVNTAEATRVWTGDTWDFTTTGYRVLDDMEEYTDAEGTRIFDRWVDGWNTTTNGSRVGHRETPFAEKTIRHGGRQSMPLVYDNHGPITSSEATQTFRIPQDWTRNGVKTVVLFFRGEPSNARTVPMWIKVADQQGAAAKVVYGSAAGEDVTSLTEPAWTQWSIPLSRLAGLSLSKVKSITIGFGAGEGSGRVFFDDIRLCPAACAVAAPTLAGWWKLDNDAQDSSGNGNHGALGVNPTWTAGRIGAALYLNGTDDHVDCGSGATLDITDRITVAAWIKPNDVGNGEHNDFVSKGDHAFALKHNKNNTLEFFIYDGAWYSAGSGVLTPAFNGSWHHVAGTYDGTQVKLYIDGKLTAATLHTGTIASTSHHLNIGRNSELTVRQYNGVIDDVRIYHGALPTSEIARLANP